MVEAQASNSRDLSTLGDLPVESNDGISTRQNLHFISHPGAFPLLFQWKKTSEKPKTKKTLGKPKTNNNNSGEVLRKGGSSQESLRIVVFPKFFFGVCVFFLGCYWCSQGFVVFRVSSKFLSFTANYSVFFVVLILFHFCRFDCICEKLSTNTKKTKPRPHGHPFCLRETKKDVNTPQQS